VLRVAALTVSVVCAGQILMAAQAGGVSITIGYDEFMVKPVSDRIEVFNEISPENRAMLVRTHLDRWIRQNRARLTAEQLAAMEANLAFITADKYRTPRQAGLEAERQKLEETNARLFSHEEMRQALTIHGDYIPPLGKQ
jgi:hypothetical protein